jgi:hypothetical protein
MELWSLGAVVLMAALHVFAAQLGRALGRPTWIPIANGLSVAYVIVHLLPEMAETQAEWLAAWPDRPLGWLDRQVYVAALLGLLLSLWLDRLASRRASPGATFWLDTGSFAIYNVIIGGLGLRVRSLLPLILAAIAFGAHFLVNDHGLYTRNSRDYARSGRWLLAGSIILGWVLVTATRPHVIVVAALLGLLSGGIMLNVIKDEVPDKREGRYALFVLGAVVYASLLLAIRYIARPT